MNYDTSLGNPWHSCTTYGCNRGFNAGDHCQCNDGCKEHGNCCHDYESHCEAAGPTLFCFALMQPFGSESWLLEMQHRMKAGIFACAATSVYSSRAGNSAFDVLVIEGLDTHVGWSQQFNSVLNTAIFVEVWKRVFADRTFMDYDWSVKADPDTVFLPGRLVEHLRWNEDGYPNGRVDTAYVLNCGRGLHGPLEVITQKAMERFAGSGLAECEQARVSDWNMAGEDAFASSCFDRLGFDQIIDFGVLDEEHCGGTTSSCLSGKVAFHPFKDPGTWASCLMQAQR